MSECFAELDAAFAEQHPGSAVGCSAAVALVIGDRLVAANVGDIACCGCARSGETFRIAKPHLPPGADDSDEEDEDEEAEAQTQTPGGDPSKQLRPTRAFGNLDLKGSGKDTSTSSCSSATPDVTVLKLEHQHHGFAFVSRDLYKSIGGSAAVATVFRRS